MNPLAGFRVLSLALNLPGPCAAAGLRQLGAAVSKVEPSRGDALAHVRPAWYQALHEGVAVTAADLKEPAGRRHLEELLARSDLLLTSNRLSALRRLGLGWDELHARHPRLCHVAIIGYPPPHEDIPGHDLTYQAKAGLVRPPELPATCLADLAGAERAVSAALALLLARERGQGAGLALVSLAEAASDLAEPLRQGVTAPGALLGGGSPFYHLYRAREGWVALAALEPHFAQGLLRELGLDAPDRERLRAAFLARTAGEWEEWAAARDLPLVAVEEPAV